MSAPRPDRRGVRPRAALLLLAALAPLAGCGGEAEPERAASAGAAPSPVLEDVVATRIAELEAALPAPAPAPARSTTEPRERAEVELDQRVRGLVRDLAQAQGDWQELILEDLASAGEPAVGRLVAVLADATEKDGVRAAACRALGALDLPRAAERLVELVETAPEPWLRAHAAWHLASTTQDQVVPRLVLRLKYERDWEAVIWIGNAIARLGNYSGLEGLYNARANAPAEAQRAAAAARLAEIAATAEVDSPDELWRRWHAGEIAGPTPSDRHRLEIWRWIERVSGAHFQLRGVDDARHVLASGAPWVAELLAEALSDRDLYTRVHVAQCLERMGPRGRPAGPALVAALGDPALAPDAATALGGVGHLPALDELAARLAPEQPLELRVACARGLGKLWVPEVVPPLAACLTPETPPDLRQAAATALLGLDSEGGPGLAPDVARAALAALVPAMSAETADRAAAELAVGRWIATTAAEAFPGVRELRAAWAAADDTPPGILPTAEEARARIAARAALARAALLQAQ